VAGAQLALGWHVAGAQLARGWHVAGAFRRWAAARTIRRAAASRQDVCAMPLLVCTLSPLP